MAIKLEVGKHYEMNNGEVYKCTSMHGDDPLAVNEFGHGPFVIKGCRYHQDGTFADRAAAQEYSGVKRCVDDAPKLWCDMTQEEKGALLLAHHEGETIQLLDPTDRTWVMCVPAWVEDIAYRVKLEPAMETVTLYGYNYNKDQWAFGTAKEDGDTHRITFNVADGKTDCASVKMEEL